MAEKAALPVSWLVTNKTHETHCTFQQFPDTCFRQMQDSIINIVQEGVQRETSNTQPQVQSVKTYERETNLSGTTTYIFF